MGHEPFTFVGAAVADTAGGLLRAHHRDLFDEAFGAVPATQHPPGGDPHNWSDLTSRERRSQTAVAPEPAGAATVDKFSLQASAVWAVIAGLIVLPAAVITDQVAGDPLSGNLGVGIPCCRWCRTYELRGITRQGGDPPGGVTTS